MIRSGRVRVRVPAKINLWLAVGDLRPDGYHDVVTVYHAVGLFDEVVVEPASRLSVRTVGARGVPNGAKGVPTGAKNLAGQAVRALAQASGRPGSVKVEITKQIPVAGGMAGGSADAAAALVGTAALWGLDLNREQLAEIAAGLGSDVPFALSGGTAIGTGRGERISPVLAREPLVWVLGMAHEGLLTPAVFGELDRLRAQRTMKRLDKVDGILAALATGDPRKVAKHLGNDLQAAAISLQPSLQTTLDRGLRAGALAGIVSGSGPTVAFLCDGDISANEVAADLHGSGLCQAVRLVVGPVPGARVITD